MKLKNELPIQPENKGKILVAEDNDDLAQLFKYLFEAENFAVTLAQNGFDAFKTFAEQKHDAILADIEMPELTGFQLLKITKVLWPHTPFFMMTGDISWSRSKELPRNGAAGVFEKGSDPSGFVANIVQTILLQRSC